MDKKLIELTDDNFEEEVVNSDIPVVVDFYAEWCGPCKMMNPILEDLSEEFEGKVKVCKANIEKTTLTGRYNVSNIPAILVFNHGNVENTMVGVQSKNVIKEAMTQGVTQNG